MKEQMTDMRQLDPARIEVREHSQWLMSALSGNERMRASLPCSATGAVRL
jgi:hypothetical protein